MKTVKYSVPNINCMHCVHTIKTELSDINGVSSVEADAATKTVEIQFSEPATVEEILKALAEINYPAKQ